MSPPKPVALDTSLLVGLADSRDVWHHAAVTLRDALKGAQAQMVYFDCVISEAINVLARRAKERTPQSFLAFRPSLAFLACLASFAMRHALCSMRSL